MTEHVQKNKVFFIAEAGVNHNGSLGVALKMINLAKKAGADCIKFQAFSLNSLLAKNTQSAKYQKASLGLNSQWQVLANLRLKKFEYKKLFRECKKKNIEFLCTAFDESWLNFLISIGMKRIKIPSGEINNIPFLKKAASYNLDIILSTGMSNIKEIGLAIREIKKINSKLKVSLLHCTSLYPAPYDSLNLKAIKVLQEKFKVHVGYSDHSLGNIASISSVAMGARIIEKHFTLDKKLKGPDHNASANFHELKKLIKDIRNLELALGEGEKKPDIREKQTAEVSRKSWHARKKIFKNYKIKTSDVHLIRPGVGIPGNINIVGKKANINIKSGSLIKKEWLT